MKLNLLYITPDFIDLSVFISQIHILLETHAKYHHVTLVAFATPNEITRSKTFKSNYEIILIPKKRLIPVPFYHRKFLKNKKLVEVLKRADVIHCRSHYAISLAIRWKKSLNLKKPVIGDIRGAVIEEIAESSARFKKIQTWIYRREEKKIFQYANHLFLMSEKMHNYYSINMGYVIKAYSIFPTIVDDSLFKKNELKRQEIRNKYKIGNKYTYIYVGGLNYWQNVHLMLKAFLNNTKGREKDFCFLLASNEIENLLELIKKESKGEMPPHVIPLRLKHSEVPAYLNAADAGVIIRKESPINYVASPTKVNEYAACGLKICNKLEYIGNANASLESLQIKSFKDIIKEQHFVYKNLIQNKE